MNPPKELEDLRDVEADVREPNQDTGYFLAVEKRLGLHSDIVDRARGSRKTPIGSCP
jgi:hypothetical protein